MNDVKSITFRAAYELFHDLYIEHELEGILPAKEKKERFRRDIWGHIPNGRSTSPLSDIIRAGNHNGKPTYLHEKYLELNPENGCISGTVDTTSYFDMLAYINKHKRFYFRDVTNNLYPATLIKQLQKEFVNKHVVDFDFDMHELNGTTTTGYESNSHANENSHYIQKSSGVESIKPDLDPIIILTQEIEKLREELSSFISHYLSDKSSKLTIINSPNSPSDASIQPLDTIIVSPEVYKVFYTLLVAKIIQKENYTRYAVWRTPFFYKEFSGVNPQNRGYFHKIFREVNKSNKRFYIDVLSIYKGLLYLEFYTIEDDKEWQSLSIEARTIRLIRAFQEKFHNIEAI